MKKVAISCLLFIVVLEISLRASGAFKNYHEKTTGSYIPQYRQKTDSWFHIWKPNTIVHFNQSEFNFYNKINEWGHRENPIDTFLQDSTSIKVLCIGDSFTEGDGVRYNDAWVRRFENLLNKHSDTSFLIYNAGVCGSDVFYNQKILKEKLIQLKPSIVIEALNSSDIEDVIARGGEERFNPDGTTTGKVGPRWEFLFQHFHIFRAFIIVVGGYNDNLIKNKLANQSRHDAVKKIEKQVYKTWSWCKNNNIDYYLIIHPVPHEIEAYDHPFIFDNYFHAFSFAYNISSSLKEKWANEDIHLYSWPINAHFNKIGYFEMGNVIFDELKCELFFNPDFKQL